MLALSFTKRLPGIILVLGISACSAFSNRRKEPVRWEGHFVGVGKPHELYLEIPDPKDDPDFRYVYFIPAGKPRNDPNYGILLFNVHGDRARSTHVRHSLRNDCPAEMLRNSEGIQFIDLCDGSRKEDEGFYRWIGTEGRVP